MAQGEPRLCGAHAGRPLELFCEDCGCCVCALCPALGAHRGNRACLLPQAARRSLNLTAKKEPGTVLKTLTPVDRLLFLKHARSPTWEYHSIHPKLKLSEDHLEVSCSWRRILCPCSPQRSDKLWQVLSRDAFLSGSYYWEVDLLCAGERRWIGAAYPTIGRKGDSEACRLGWNRASWCLKFDFEYWAFHKGERIPILVEDDPDCIGIFLDYEAGILSFYNISNGMAHLHTFCCNFTEPVYPALRLWEGSIRTCKLT